MVVINCTPENSFD